MDETVFSYNLKVVECSTCGAPVVTKAAGGRVSCSSCGAPLIVAERFRERRQAMRVEEQGRIAGLHAQVESYHYQRSIFRKPEGLESFTEMLNDPATRSAGFEAYRQSWEKTRRRLSENDTPETETHFCRLALSMADIFSTSGQNDRVRAVLETALDLLREPDYRDIIRCRLARFALLSGDAVAGAAWLQDVDPTPLRIEVDTEYRLSLSLLHLSGQNYSSMVELLGSRGGDVPLIPQIDGLDLCLRSHGCAGVGDIKNAKRSILMSANQHDVAWVEWRWQSIPGPATSFAGRTASRAKKLASLAFSVAAFLLVTVIFVPVCTPSCYFVSCGSDVSQAEAVLVRLRQCPAAREALGKNITWAVGSSCGHGQCGPRFTYVMSVKGDKARGKVRYNAKQHGKSKIITMAYMMVDGKRVDFVPCRPIKK